MDRTSQENITYHSRQTFFSRILSNGFARPWMVFVLLISDAISLFLAGIIALVLWHFVRSDLIIQNYVDVLPLLVLFIIVYTIAGLYPAIGLSPVDELRLLTITTTLAFFGMGTLSFYLRNVESYSRASFGLAWLFAIILLPLNRHLLRKSCSWLGCWGEPVVLIGFGEWGSQILDVIIDQPELGMRPVAVIDGFNSSNQLKIPIPYYALGGQVNLDRINNLSGVKTAILIQTEIPSDLYEKIISENVYKFSHLIMILDGQFGSSVWVKTRDIGGVLGLEVRQNLCSRYEQAIKRGLDIFLIMLGSPFLAVLFVFIAIVIRLDSPGPVLFSQFRVGKNRKQFKIWKFRTMVVNADMLLKQAFDQHPELVAEWEQTHKLKRDPRVTRVGKLLRRFSLDEYPQFWNVIKGEMSLVGPRPIMEAEISHYRTSFHLYTRVRPGLTGLWQISGRNDISYEQRVKLDSYYVINWSIWLDLYILVKTAKAIIDGKGAY